jgi:RES domain-containing protein
LILGSKEIPVIALHQRCWRILAPKWAHDPLSGQGAALYGGRFNPKGTPALYLSESIDTAFAEYQQELMVRPGTFCAYQIEILGIADLCDPIVTNKLQVATQTLVGAWKEILLIQKLQPPTWDLAIHLIGLGFAGIRVPSAQQQGGINIVLWRWNDDPLRSVEVLDPKGELPRNQNSWK